MSVSLDLCFFFFFFNDTATTEIYTLSLHDALPISARSTASVLAVGFVARFFPSTELTKRSEEHTSELQSQSNLVCRLLLEKKKTNHRLALHSLHPPASLLLPAPSDLHTQRRSSPPP